MGKAMKTKNRQNGELRGELQPTASPFTNSLPDIIGCLVDHLGKVLTSEIAGVSPHNRCIAGNVGSQQRPSHLSASIRESYAISRRTIG